MSTTQINPLHTVVMDNVDIDNFFRHIHLPQNGLIKPLWTNIGCKEEKLYKFEVLIENNNFSDVDDNTYYDHNFVCEFFTCHICNLKVPKIYLKEHNQSTKHKICLEIANTSLERLKKQINEDYSYQTTVLLDSYFCPSCSAAVVTELKGHHEKTLGHLVSKKHDELLEELLKYYLDVNNVKIDDNLENTELLNNISGEMTNSVDKNTKDESGNIDNVKAAKTESNENIKGSDDATATETDENNVKKDVNLMSDSINANNIEENGSTKIVNDVNIGNQTSKSNTEAKLSTSIDTAENKVDKGATKNETKLKKDVVDKDINTDASSFTSSTDISAKNKKASNSVGVSTNSSNNNKNQSQNVSAKKHTPMNLSFECNHDPFLSFDSNKIKHSKPGFLLNKGLKRRKVIFTKLEYWQAYYSKLSMLHQLKLIDEHTLKIKTVNGSILKILVNNFHSFIEVNGKIQCDMCKEIVQEDIESHYMTPDHMMYCLIPIFDSNCIRKINGLHSHCILCNELVEDCEFHIKTEKHASNLQEALYFEEVSTAHNEITTIVYQNAKNHDYCEICEVHYGANNYESHSKSKKHRINYDKKFPIISAAQNCKKNCGDELSPTSNPNEMSCKICNVTVATKNSEEHLKGSNHVFKRNALLIKGKLRKPDEGNYCNLCDVPISNVAVHSKTEKHIYRVTVAISDHFRPFLPNNFLFYCIVCEDLVCNEQSKIVLHLNTTQHCSKLSKMFSEHGLEKVDDQYFCPFCKELLDGNEVKHIKSDNHLIKSNKKREDTSKPIVFRESLPENIVIHSHMDTTENATELQCKVCLVKLPISLKYVKKHLKAEHHIQCFSRLLGNFKNINDNYVCDICHVKMDAYLLVDHIKCKSKAMEAAEAKKINGDASTSCDLGTWMDLHKHMVETALPGSLQCLVCQVYVPKNTQCVDIHVNGLKHKNKHNEVILKNKLVKQNNDVYCNFCRVLIADDKEIEHINSELHKFMVENTENVPEKNSERMIHYLMENKNKELEYLYCKLCKIYIADEPLCIKNHMISNTHEVQYKDLLQKNHLTSQNDLYFCGFCKELLAKNGEFKHISSGSHKLNMSQNSSNVIKYMCEICKVEVPNNPKNITEHQLGAVHKNKVKATEKND